MNIAIKPSKGGGFFRVVCDRHGLSVHGVGLEKVERAVQEHIDRYHKDEYVTVTYPNE